jgi:hypothetical protein
VAVLGIRKLSKVVVAFLVNICKKALPPPPFYICLLSYFSFPFLTFCYLASFLIFFYTSYYSFYFELCSLFFTLLLFYLDFTYYYPSPIFLLFYLSSPSYFLCSVLPFFYFYYLYPVLHSSMFYSNS